MSRCLGIQSRIVATLVLLALAAAPLAGAEPNALREHHPWGRFAEGSSTTVRIFTETLDAAGQVTHSSTTQSKTTLEKLTDEGVTLKVESTVELAGKSVTLPVERIRHGFADEAPGQSVALKRLDPTTLNIDGKSVLCQSQQIEVAGAGNRRVTLVRYSDQVSPHILRRELVVTDPASGVKTQESTTEVIALDKPYKVLGVVRNAAYLKTVQKQDEGLTVTLSVHVEDVPGEIVAHTLKKLDSQGHPIRRSTLELIGFHEVEPREASGDTSSSRPEESRRAQRRKERAARAARR